MHWQILSLNLGVFMVDFFVGSVYSSIFSVIFVFKLKSLIYGSNTTVKLVIPLQNQQMRRGVMGLWTHGPNELLGLLVKEARV